MAKGIELQEGVILENTDIDRENLSLIVSTPSSSTAIWSRDDDSSGFVATWSKVSVLALPLAISRLSWSAMKTTDTALIGHTGTLNLSASAVSDLYTQSTGVFVNGWVLSTLVSQAYGGTNKTMGGIWLQVSLVVLTGLSLPVMLSWMLCGPVLRAFGVSEDLIAPAAYYALILMIALPARIGIGQLAQFLMAQGITNPLVKTGLFSMSLNLVLGIVLVLGIGIPGWDGFGFWVCPVVTTVVEWATLFIYLYWFCYKKQLHKKGGCWPHDGFQRAHVTRKRLKEYVNLYYPAALAAASDWWRVSAIGVVAVTFHDHASLAVFNSSYRIAWMSLIVVGSIGSAMGVLVGQELGKGDYRSAKSTTWSCLALSCGFILLLASVFYAIPGKVALIFSSDTEVIGLYKEVALPLTTMLISMNVSVVLERVPLSCGRTQVVLWTGLIGSWAAQVPAVLLCTAFYRNDLYGLFTGVTLGYCALDVLLFVVVHTTDWAHFAEEAKRRSEAAGDLAVNKLEEDVEDAAATSSAERNDPLTKAKGGGTTYNSIQASDTSFNADEVEDLW